MLENVQVKKTSNPDNGYESEDILFMDTLYHIDDVEKTMDMLASHLEDIGDYHDYTKLEYFDEFAKDCLERLTTPEFKKRAWYNIHTTQERHHINASIPENVDLFDILEMIVDCVIAGKTRSGSVNKEFLIITDDVLKDAYWNTVDKIEKHIIVMDEEKV